MPFEERKAIKDLRSNSGVVIKKADKGTTTVIMKTKDKLQEGQVLLDDKNNYTPLTTPMGKETARTTRVIINDLHQGNHIDTMTKNGFYKHLTHRVYQFSTHLQRFTNRPYLEDQ